MTVRAPRKTFRDLLKVDGPLVLPGAHDALSARLIEQAGFEGYFIGGFPAVGARYGVPDVGLKGLGEIAAAVHDILGATDLPVFVDIDDGYGDVKNAVHTMHTYERMGVAAMQIEDQKWPKRCGHMAGKTVVACEEMEAKIRAMAGERINPDTFIWARTDSRAPLGLDEALRRAERYLRAGADALFIEAPRTIEELERGSGVRHEVSSGGSSTQRVSLSHTALRSDRFRRLFEHVHTDAHSRRSVAGFPPPLAAAHVGIGIHQKIHRARLDALIKRGQRATRVVGIHGDPFQQPELLAIVTEVALQCPHQPDQCIQPMNSSITRRKAQTSAFGQELCAAFL